MSDIRNLLNTASTIPSPIVLDLNSDGVTTTALTSGTYFDHAGDGFAEQTAWISAEDGLLVRDLNNNGTIDTGAELFGNNTVLANAQKAANGFLALADLDSNKDGKIESSDAAFSELQIWKDSDGDGITSTGELHSLAELGIASISTAYTASSTVDANGNAHSQIGTYTTTDGQIGAATDVWFKTDSTYSFATEILEVPEEILTLPEISGYGKVRSLQQAMVRNSSLKDLVVQFAATTNATDRQTLTTQIIYSWAGVENVDPASRTNSYYGNVIGDARKLEALEEFVGEEWYGIWCWGTKDPNPHGPAAPTVLKAYDMLFEMIYDQLMLQTHLKLLVDSIVYVWDEATSSIHGDLSNTAPIVTEQIFQNRSAGKELLAEFMRCFSFEGVAYDTAAFQTLLAPLGLDVTSIVNSALSINGTSGNDTLIGTGAGDIMQGFSGNDVLTGNAGDDWLEGGAGNDTLYGNAGNDKLFGGTGADQIYGNEGSDTYSFSKGDGQDTIHDDYLQDSGISLSGLTLESLVFKRSGADLIVTFTDNATDSIKLVDFFRNGEPATNLVITTETGASVTFDAASLIQLSLYPSENADVLDGSSNADTLNALGGDDLVYGRSGDDILDGGSGNDNISGNDGDDQIAGGLGSDILYGGTGIDTLNGDDGDDRLFGDDGNDNLLGNAGNDTLDGGLGVDTLTGGTGDDLYYLENAADALVENAGEGTDTVYAMATFTMAANIENASLLGSGDIDATGNSGGNTLLGNSGANNLYGLTGNDTLNGYEGDDTLDGEDGQDYLYGGLGVDSLLGGLGNDKMYGEDGADTLNGNDGDDLMDGGSGNDILFGGAGNDFLDGNVSADSLSGGTGDDSYIIDDSGDTITEFVGEGVDNVNSSVSFAISANVENLLLVGSTNIDGIGNSADNVLLGNSGANHLYGLDGNDELSGNAGDDVLDGGAGNDMLDGDQGKDTLLGAMGDDTYYVDQSDDVVTENLNEGDDTVRSTASYNLSADVENLILESAAGYGTATGNSLANTLTGNEYGNTLSGSDGNDTLYGMVGNDTLLGGSGADNLIGGDDDDRLDGGTDADSMTGDLGNDIYVVDTVADVVVESAGAGIDTVETSISYVLGSNLENLTLTGTANIDATGTGLANTVRGNSGNNRIDGGAGADWMAGGAGNDTYLTEMSGDWIVENAGEGADLEIRNYETTLILNANVENLTLGGTIYRGNGNNLDNIITGNDSDNNLFALAGNDTLIGGAGNDALFGSLGQDALIGGTGDDYYEIDNAADVIIENAGEGDDFVRATVSWTLGANLERLAVDGTSALSVAGNELGNGLWGNQGNNVITGGLGNDYLYGDTGQDTYVFSLGDGQDSIDDHDLASGGDILQFGTGVAENDVLAFQYGSSLFFKIKGSTDQVGFIDYFAASTVVDGLSYDHKINQVTFASGATWDQAMIQTVVDRANNNHSPTINSYLPTLQAKAGTPFTYVVPAGTITDPDPWDSITYSAKMADGSALPSWLTFDPFTRTFSGTPTASGSLQFILWGTDNYGYASGEYVNMTIGAANRAPVVSTLLADQTAAEGAAFSYTVPASAFTDPDSDTLAYSATLADGTALPSWLTFNSSTRVFSGIPPTGSSGTISVKVTAKDTGNLSVFDVFNVTVSVQHLTLNGTSGADTLTGGAGNDTLNGNAGNDTLIGNAGNDTLNGGTGNDAMKGGLGNDTYVVDSATDVITENLNEGTELVQSSVTYTLSANVENLTLTGTSASGTGNALDNVLAGNTANNTLTGGDGNDTIDGGAGSDTMVGGNGDDTYYVNVSTDKITEVASAGTDTVNSSVTLTLASNVENLILTGTSAINGTGNTLTNYLRGNVANNTLNGGSGNDIMDGGIGTDTLTDTSGKAYLNGGAGTDTMTGGTGVELFIGGTGNDTITASTGADILAFNRGDGVDTVNGGTGTDNTVSLGGGIRYADLNFKKSGNDLVLDVGSSESLTFKNWYVTTANNKSVAKLQVILDATSDYNAASTDQTLNNKVEQFDFAGLVTKFDAARAANTSLTSWALTNALSQHYLVGSDTAAMGGDLAYWYGKNGSLSGMNVASAQEVVVDANFGTANQTVRSFTGLQNGLVRLT